MSQRVLVVGLLVLLALPANPSSAWAADCDQWGQWSWMMEFFEVATPEDVRGCLSAGADANAINIDAPLHWAASGDPAIVALLIEHGADVNVKGDFGHTPLHYAVRSGNPKNVVLLLDAGADVSAWNNNGYHPTTPLHDAATIGNIEILHLLLDAGADVSAHRGFTDTPLHSAAWFSGDPAVIQVLLDAGSDVNVPPDQTFVVGGEGILTSSPLHSAAARAMLFKAPDEESWCHRVPPAEEVAGLTLLLEAGADVNARTHVWEDQNWEHYSATWGETPLHYAAAGGCELAIETLLDFGADPTLHDAKGNTPWDFIKDREELKGSAAYRRLREATLGEDQDP